MSQIDPNTVVSIVCCLQNDADILADFLKDLDDLLGQRYEFFEIILVDDCSSDATRQTVLNLLAKVQKVRYLRLSREFGSDVALSAGIESALGDVVVTLSPKTDPIDQIPRFVEQAKSTGGVVHGVCNDLAERGPLREILGRLFRSYCQRFLGVKLTRGAANFRGMNRAAVNALLQVKLQNRYLRVLTATLGYEQTELTYESTGRSNRRLHSSLVTELATGLDLVAAHTRHPLRFVTWSGVFAAGLSIFYALYALIIFLIKPNVAAGWTTLSLLMSGMFFFIFLILAVLGEYVGTILNEVRGRPLYFVAEEKNSSVLLEDTVETSLVSDSKE